MVALTICYLISQNWKLWIFHGGAFWEQRVREGRENSRATRDFVLRASAIGRHRTRGRACFASSWRTRAIKTIEMEERDLREKFTRWSTAGAGGEAREISNRADSRFPIPIRVSFVIDVGAMILPSPPLPLYGFDQIRNKLPKKA